MVEPTDQRRSLAPRRKGRTPIPIADRIRSAIRVTPTGCWEWTRKLRPNGYGQIFVGSRYAGDRRIVLAHRASYEAFVGPIPDGLTLDHLCHTRDRSCPGGDGCQHRRCVNPDHLQPVTFVENVLRGEAPAARNARKTHCHKGHEFTPENTYLSGSKRYCRACGAEYRATRRKQLRAARKAA